VTAPRLALAAALALTTATAAAQDAPSVLRLAWARGDGADRCPAQSAVMDAVRARLGRDPFTADATTSAEVLIERAGRWRARILFRDASGAVLLRRELDDGADDCAAITAAAVLSVALALAPVAPTPVVVTPAVAVTPAIDNEVAAPPRPVVPEVRTTPRATPRRVRLVGAAELLVGALPSLAAGAAVHVDLLLTRRWAFSFSAALSPEQRVDTWAFGLTRASASACFRAHPHRRVELSPCAGVSFGLVHAVTFGPTPLEPGNYPWLGVHLDARGLARLGGPWIMYATVGGAWVPLRQEFVVVFTGAASQSVYAQSPVAAWGSLGVGVEL
jgi:hypothetical protein